MKNITLVFALTLISLFAIAQKTTLSLGPEIIGLTHSPDGDDVSSGITLSLETALSKRFTASVDGTFAGKNLLDFEEVKLKRRVNSVKIGLKLYPKAAHRGFFIGVNVAYTNLKYGLKGDETGNIKINADSFLLGGLDMGFKAAISDRFTLSIHTGLNMDPSNDFDDGGLQYNMGAKVGFKF